MQKICPSYSTKIHSIYNAEYQKENGVTNVSMEPLMGALGRVVKGQHF